MNTGTAGASHSESIPQSVCAPLTQCSLWTLSAVLFLSSQITAFQMGSSLWHGSCRLDWDAGEVRETVWEMQRPWPRVRCRMQRSSTQARTNSDNLEVPTFLLVGISFKCQIIHLEQVTQTFGDLLGECQTRTMNLYKALGKVQCPLASHSAAWGEEVRHPGLRRLGHAALIKCTCNLRLRSVS